MILALVESGLPTDINMHKKMKLPVQVTEVLATLKAKSKIKGSSENTTKKQANTATENDPFVYEEILKVIGFSWWQLRLIILLALISVCDGLFDSLFEFTAFTPKYRCSIPFCETVSNTSYYAYNSTSFAKYVDRGVPKEILNTGQSCQYLGFLQIPQGMDQEIILNKESCDFYLSETRRNSSDLALTNCPLESLVFDKTIIETSIVSSFKLTCDKKWIKNFTKVLHQAGQLIGFITFGILCDKKGRLKSLLFSLCITSFLGILSAFSSDIGGFAFFYFCLGISQSGLFIPSIIGLCEGCGLTTSLILFPMKSLGALTSSLVSMMIPQWNSLHLTSFSFGLVAFIPLAIFGYESPRWLISKGQNDKARDIMKRAAVLNNRELKATILHPDKDKDQRKNEIPNPDKEEKEFNLTETLFKKSFYKWWIANLSLQWIFLGLALKGQLIQINTASPFANVCFEALTAIPGFLLALIFAKSYTRPLLTFCYLITALMFLVQSLGLYYLSHEWSLFGHISSNIFLHACLATISLLAMITAPTSLRGSFYGLYSALFTIGIISSHLLNLLVLTSQWLPTTVMAVLSLICSMLTYYLPETSELQSFPEVWKDIEEIQKTPRKSYWQFKLDIFDVRKLRALIDNK